MEVREVEIDAGARDGEGVSFGEVCKVVRCTFLVSHLLCQRNIQSAGTHVGLDPFEEFASAILVGATAAKINPAKEAQISNTAAVKRMMKDPGHERQR